MGRLAALHPGTDGLVRVVSVKTSTGIMKRPIVKICQLMSDEETQPLVSNFIVLKNGFFNSAENVQNDEDCKEKIRG